VQVQRNDYALDLFNGDIGIAWPAAGGRLMVFFADAGGAFRAIAPARLPVHATAFATTVHQAQGSEFDRLLLLLPSRPSRVVTRELLYTAVTRARVGLEIAGPAAVLQHGVATPTERDGGLGARLRERASDPSSPPAVSLAAERPARPE
jgi:exodeoxyribonuclease V alpha subunit